MVVATATLLAYMVIGGGSGAVDDNSSIGYDDYGAGYCGGEW